MSIISRFTRSLVAVAALVASSHGGGARADILIVSNQGQTIAPLSAVAPWQAVEESDIEMASETVEIAQDETMNFDVECDFTMKSHAAQTLTRNVAFPLIDPRYAGFMSRYFTVTVDGVTVESQTVMNVDANAPRLRNYWRADEENFDYAGYVIWPVTWQAGETKHIKCVYNMGAPEWLWGLGRGWRLRYIVRTGALWKNNIGSADIRIKFRVDPRTDGYYGAESRPGVQFEFRSAPGAQWISPTEVRWHFENWNPTQDLTIERTAWLGLSDESSLPLPEDYRGDKAEYSEGILAKMSEEFIAPWRKLYPQQTDEIDGAQLKSLAADALYHEILARHGDPFIVGRVGGKPRPKGVKSESGDGDLYSKWSIYFWPYQLHGGWYRPDLDKRNGVDPIEFNAFETANLEFLRKYLPKPE